MEASTPQKCGYWKAPTPRRFMAKEKGSKQLILDFFLVNIGRVIESKELQEASGWKAEWARRVRELREGLFRRLDLDAIALRTDRSYLPALTTFFEARARRLRH